MQNTRQNKICRLIQQDMGDIFLREVKSCQWPADSEADLESLRKSLITVTEVRITPDLSIARIYLSIMVIGNGTADGIMALIRANTGDLRRRLGMREGKQLRIIPQLEFYIDDTLDYIENINRLLKQ
ncbi:MAG: ribosome-binding factor A [Bacteroidales bacterium]|nr:ribosome-binding factor A [Bacteroidales bacterium]